MPLGAVSSCRVDWDVSGDGLQGRMRSGKTGSSIWEGECKRKTCFSGEKASKFPAAPLILSIYRSVSTRGPARYQSLTANHVMLARVRRLRSLFTLARKFILVTRRFSIYSFIHHSFLLPSFPRYMGKAGENGQREPTLALVLPSRISISYPPHSHPSDTSSSSPKPSINFLLLNSSGPTSHQFESSITAETCAPSTGANTNSIPPTHLSRRLPKEKGSKFSASCF